MLIDLIPYVFIIRKTISSILKTKTLIFWIEHGGLSFILSLLKMFFPDYNINIPFIDVSKKDLIQSFTKRKLSYLLGTNITSYRQFIYNLIYRCFEWKLIKFNFYVLGFLLPKDQQNIWLNNLSEKNKYILERLNIPWDKLKSLYILYSNKDKYSKKELRKKIYEQNNSVLYYK